MTEFFAAVYADNEARARADRRRRLPDVLRHLRNALLAPLDRLLVARHAPHASSVVFVVGAPRSGTTLLYQLIARHLDVAYVSNDLARFWSAPLVGAAWLARTRGAARPGDRFRSDFGRDPDPGGPHEFSWFWHAHGRFADHDDLRGAERDAVDWKAIADRLAALSGFHERPFVVKSLNFTDYHVPVLTEALPDARFVWIRRDPLYACQSILDARRRRYGDVARWWSIRPRDVADWADRTPAEQVVHQVRDVEHALAKARAQLPPERFLELTYEALVERPARVLVDVARFLGVGARDLGALEPSPFKTRNQTTLEPELLAALERALEAP
ncbi:MAG: sulfotransferase [Myxococcota bacterium]